MGGMQVLAGLALSGQIVGSLFRVIHERAKRMTEVNFCWSNQGTLTEGEGLVQVTTLY